MQNNQRQSTMEHVLAQLGNRAPEIVHMLPQDLPIDRFRANVINALRNTPSILDCTPQSIIKACMKAAYDGLRLDGKEAALVVHENVYNRGKPGERKVKEAEYFPMAQGLIQQILRGGEVKSIYAEVIRENDSYLIRRGTNPGIEHDINLDKPRGEVIGAYSVATLSNGYVTFEILDRHDLNEIKKAAKTDKVWNRWPGEMSKKSAIRRHRKTLPLGDRDIIINDSEASDLYDGIDAGRESLPAPSQRREAPTRAAIANQHGTENGTPMDLGDEEEGVVIDQTARRDDRQDEQKKGLPETDNSGESLNPGDIPQGADEWFGWSQDIENSIKTAKNADEVNQIARDEATRIEAADKDIASYIRDLITERLTDFATGGEG